MNNLISTAALAVMCALVVTGCGGGSASPRPSGSAAPSSVRPSTSLPALSGQPSSALVSPAPIGSPIYSDTLATDDGAWPTGPQSGIDPEFAAGIYQVTISKPGGVFLGAPPAPAGPSDASVQVDFSFANSADQQMSAGVVCRNSDASRYALNIRFDGRWSISSQTDPAKPWTLLIDWAKTDALKHGSATQTVRFDCYADTLTGYLNGTLLGNVSDSTLTAGGWGVEATLPSDASGDPALVVDFSNFAVSGGTP